ncbi:MAG: acyloxyacyl hydrolase [Stellaceae bacterium]
MYIRTVLWVLATLLAAGRAEAAVGILDEAKLGLLNHDIAIGGDHREPGVDVNGELLFVSPPVLSAVFAPRPHFGVEINSDGKNSYAYGGLTLTANFTDRVFADLGLGGAIHDGPDQSSPATRHHKGLGTRFLFHESVDLGYRLTPRWDVAAYLDHVSNADIGGHNPGITNLGARVGYSF